MLYVTLLAFLICTFVPVSASAQNSNKVNIAIEFLKSACVSKGKKVEIEAKGKAGLTIRQLKDAGVNAEVSFSEKEVEGLVTELNEIEARQANEIRECMKPYIDKILNVILGLEESPQPKKESVDIKPISIPRLTDDDLGVKYVDDIAKFISSNVGTQTYINITIPRGNTTYLFHEKRDTNICRIVLCQSQACKSMLTKLTIDRSNYRAASGYSKEKDYYDSEVKSDEKALLGLATSILDIKECSKHISKTSGGDERLVGYFEINKDIIPQGICFLLKESIPK